MVIPKTVASAGETPKQWGAEKSLPVPVTHSVKKTRRLLVWQVPLAVVLMYVVWKRFT